MWHRDDMTMSDGLVNRLARSNARERADLAAQKAVERERKQEAIEAGRAHAEQHNRSNADKLLRLTTILHRGLDRRAAAQYRAGRQALPRRLQDREDLPLLVHQPMVGVA